MRTVKEVYEGYRHGNSFTDAEGVMLFKHFDELSELLVKSGPVFHLAFKEANRVRNDFQDFLTSRGVRAFKS